MRIRSPCPPSICSTPYPHALHTSHAKYPSLFSAPNPPGGTSKKLARIHRSRKVLNWDQGMATTSATSAQAVFTCSTVRSSSSRSTTTKVNYTSGINSFGGLKAQNQISCLGLPVYTEKAFAKVLNSTRASYQRTGRGGGALSSTCNAVAEIFKIAAIMNGLVLVGVAVGFVLLRVEAAFEEE